jgi:hypothetical protein
VLFTNRTWPGDLWCLPSPRSNADSVFATPPPARQSILATPRQIGALAPSFGAAIETARRGPISNCTATCNVGLESNASVNWTQHWRER